MITTSKQEFEYALSLWRFNFNSAIEEMKVISSKDLVKSSGKKLHSAIAKIIVLICYLIQLLLILTELLNQLFDPLGMDKKLQLLISNL